MMSELKKAIANKIRKRRRFQSGKETLPLNDAGTYQITLFYHNTGDEVLRDVVIDDMIPPGSRLHPQYPPNRITSIVTVTDGVTYLRWEIDEIWHGEDVKIVYVIRSRKPVPRGFVTRNR